MDKEFENSKFNYPLIIKTAILNIFVTALFIFIFSVIMYFVQAGYEYSTVLATVALGVGALVSSFYAAKKTKKRGFLIGLIVGGAVFLIVTLVSLFVDKGSVTLNTLFHFIIIMLSALIGGISGVNQSAKQKYV